MNNSIKAYAYSFFIFVTLINFISCNYQAVVAQIDKKIGLKQSDSYQKNQKLIILQQQDNILIQVYRQVIEKSITAANAYTAYFLQENRCQSLNPQTYFLSEVSYLPKDFCFIAPIGNDAKRIFKLSLQLADFQYVQLINKKLADEQAAFNADYYSQSKLYSKLAQSAYIPLQKAIKNFQQCMKKYATPINPTPAECKYENNTLNAREKIYGTYRYKEVTFGMASKGPFLSLQMKNGILNDSIDAVSRTQNNLKPLLQTIQQNYKQCIQNLQNVKITTNAAKKAAQQARNKLNNQNDKLFQIYISIDELITKIKADTARFLPSVKSLQELFS